MSARFDPGHPVTYYSADWGQLHLVVLDTFDKTGPSLDPRQDTVSAAQLEWLKADLDAARARGQLIFASLHHGHASHATGPSAHGPSALVGAQVIPELALRGTIASFAGHDHIYERGCAGSVDYFVAGGGGAPLYEVDAGNDPSVFLAQATLEYSLITVEGRQVTGVTKDTRGNVIDSFALPTPGCQLQQLDAGVVDDGGVVDAGHDHPPPLSRGGSCGSTGAGSILALLPLALFARRRRTRA